MELRISPAFIARTFAVAFKHTSECMAGWSTSRATAGSERFAREALWPNHGLRAQQKISLTAQAALGVVEGPERPKPQQGSGGSEPDISFPLTSHSK